MTAPRIRFRAESADGFRGTVTARVDEYFARTGKSRTANGFIYAKAAIYAALATAAYAALLSNTFGAAGSFVLALVYGLSVLLLAINISHDAAHIAVTGNRRIDTAMHRVLFGLVGVDGYLWRLRHDGSHHVFPNVNGCDIDIDQNPVIRLSPNHPRAPWQRYQHIYAVFVYMLTLLDSIFVNDVVYLRKRELANMRDIVHRPRDVAIFWLLKLVYLTTNIVVPLLVIRLPWWQILLGYGATTAVMSLVFVFLLIGVHFSTGAEYPRIGAGGQLRTSWAVHALATSVDWRPEDRFAHFFSGGGNAHAAHHLFPRISSCHYPAITPIVRQTAREFGLRYNETNFTGMIAAHFRHLRALARDDGALSPARSSPRRPAR